MTTPMTPERLAEIKAAYLDRYDPPYPEDAMRELIAEVERLREVIETYSRWQNTIDKSIPEDAAIEAAHPLSRAEPRDWATLDEAMRLVSAKHSKRELINLVNWLLVRIKEGANG